MEIIFQKDKNRYELRCSFEERNLAKTFHFKWCAESNTWFAPDWYIAFKAYKRLKLIQQPFREILELEQYLCAYNNSWALSPKKYQNNQLEDFQKAGVEEMLKRGKFILLADEQGLGKTIQAIEYFKHHPTAKKALVIAPATLKINWEREIKKFYSESSKVKIMRGSKDTIDGDFEFVIVNYDLLNSPIIISEIEKFNADIVFGDEIHFAKNLEAKRTKKAFEIAKKARTFVALSGTPIPNRPIEIFPLLKNFSPTTLGIYVDQRRFEYRFCAGFEDKWGFNNSGASNLDELGERMRATCMVRRLKKDTIGTKKLPPKIIAFEADSETQVLVLKEKEIAAEFLKKNKEVPTVGEIAEIRQQLALHKLPLAIQFIEDLLLSNAKVIIFAHHRVIISLLRDHFQRRFAVVVAGGMTDKAKQIAVDAFQKDPNCEIFIGQIKAAGVGLTLTAGTEEVFVETSWAPGDIEQCMDRSDRYGQTRDVQAWFLTTENSLEEHMLKVAFDKANNINKIMN
jgi:SWI/SNF-related matrix-associated actin-dependent regulator 1 of chromatin subfamily A